MMTYHPLLLMIIVVYKGRKMFNLEQIKDAAKRYLTSQPHHVLVEYDRLHGTKFAGLSREQQEELTSELATKNTMLGEIMKEAHLSTDVSEAHANQLIIVETIIEKLKLFAQVEELTRDNNQLKNDMQVLNDQHEQLKGKYTHEHNELNQCLVSQIKLSGCCDDLPSTSTNDQREL